MTTTLRPYLFFGGRCEAALQFYAEALAGRTAEIIRLGDIEPDTAADKRGWIIHALFEAGELTFMASDGMPGAEAPPSGGRVAMALGFDDTAQQERVWARLVDGGETKAPLHDTFYGGRMGVLTDRFGIQWMLNWSPPQR